MSVMHDNFDVVDTWRIALRSGGSVVEAVLVEMASRGSLPLEKCS